MLASVLWMLIDLYTLLIILAVLMSWIQVGPENPLRKVTDVTVEPVLERIRQVLPATGGLDLSPLVLLVGIYLLRRLLAGF